LHGWHDLHDLHEWQFISDAVDYDPAKSLERFTNQSVQSNQSNPIFIVKTQLTERN